MRVNSFKYLGLTLDEILNWNEHVNELCKSLIKYFGIFNHIKNKIAPVVGRQLYYLFMYSRIKYGIELYGSASNMNEIELLQNKLIKMVLKLDRLMPTMDLHKNIKILKIGVIHKHTGHSQWNGQRPMSCYIQKLFWDKRKFLWLENSSSINNSSDEIKSRAACGEV